jgi:hypothetical protein
MGCRTTASLNAVNQRFGITKYFGVGKMPLKPTDADMRIV